MLSAIPTCADLSRAVVADRYDDLLAMPGLTNFRGCVQTCHDLVALRSRNFIPYAEGECESGALYLDGRYVRT